MKSKTANLALLVLIVIAVSGCGSRSQDGTGGVTRRDATPPDQQVAAQDVREPTDRQAR